MDNGPTYAPEWLETGQRSSIADPDVNTCRKEFLAVFERLGPLLPAPPEDLTIVEERFTKDLRIRVYVPPGNGLLPLGLYIHSGGWYAGSIEAEDYQCRLIAKTSGVIIFSPGYRLAPEDPYPSGLEDCCDAYMYMIQNGHKFRGDASRKFIMGGSAGANLTACVALKYTTDPVLKPTGIIVACMVSCDPDALPSKYKAKMPTLSYHNTPLINDSSVRLAREWYNAPAGDPLYSPLLHPDIKHLSRVYVAAPTADPTYFETMIFFEECKEQYVDVKLKQWEGLPHFFWIIPSLPQSQSFMEEWCTALRDWIDETEMAHTK